MRKERRKADHRNEGCFGIVNQGKTKYSSVDGMPPSKAAALGGHICGKLPLPIFGDVRQYIKLYTPTVKVQLQCSTTEE